MKYFSRLDSIFLRISENQIVKVVRQGLLYNMPLIMIGSFMLVLLNLPIVQFSDALTGLFGENWRELCLLIHKGTYRIMSVTTLLSISYALAKDIDKDRGNRQNLIIPCITALSCYIIFAPGLDIILPERQAGPTGIFRAIVIGLIACYLFFFFSSHLPHRKTAYFYDADAILHSSISSIFPAIMTIGCFALVRVLYNYFNGSAAVLGFGNNLLRTLFQGGQSLWVVILYCLLSHIMWFFGIHGTNVLENVSQNLFASASEVNISAVAAGLMPTEIFTKQFLDVFVFLGGAGCTLGLLIALILAGRVSKASGIAKISVLPAIFNINEILVYGLPVIFNPYYLIPFLLSPVVLTVSSYIAFASGLVPLTIADVTWTTPIFISGYTSTGSVAGIILQAVNLLLSVCMYFPFVRLYEKQVARNNARIFEALIRDYTAATLENLPMMLERRDEHGVVARALATEIRATLAGAEKDVGLSIAFQPKNFSDGTVFGAEALLRWHHPKYGEIPPCVTLGIAEEAGLTVALGAWVLKMSFAQLKQWHDEGILIKLSINLSPLQLKYDLALADQVAHLISETGLPPQYIELELTEHAALDQGVATRSCMEKINGLGVNISIDDFGMGSSSLLYLRDFYANIVKLDISLVQTLETSEYSRQIVRTTMDLCDQLGVELVAEGVESEAQLAMLRDIGCQRFQGWYFSKALTPELFGAYIQSHGIASSPPEIQ
ncbi:MAG: EAL domain-containing protein [Oscillospiraceae bacterium]|nr:EAL domain-containing protein [Oscillospiraceae bacterium]